MRFPTHLSTDHTASPVLHSCSTQRNSEKNDSDACDLGREQALDVGDRQERKGQLEQTTDHGSTKHSTIRCISIPATVLHLVDGDLKNGQKRETCTHHREDTTSIIHITTKNLVGEWNLELCNIEDTADSAGNQRGRNGIRFQLRAWVNGRADGKAKDDERGSNQATNHGKAMLQSHQQGQEVRDLFILAVKVDLGRSFLLAWVGGYTELPVVVTVALPDPAGLECHGGSACRLLRFDLFAKCLVVGEVRGLL
mmetsp:Transcript_26383/g.43377  ORF Transcript_26383/g.43377 Transcript_26383/m.43377 type:complete len:253 (+) Transcript_26383:1380-2138(+)